MFQKNFQKYKIFLKMLIICVFKITIFVRKNFKIWEKTKAEKADSCIRRTRRRWVPIPGCETVHIVSNVGLLDVLQHRLLALIQFKERQTITMGKSQDEI
jgi:hypothetical protein